MKKIITLLCFAVCINTNAQVCFTNTNYPVTKSPIIMTCSDFNSDGKLDLMSISFDTETIYMLPGDGNGGFGPATMVYTTIDNPIIRCIISGDFNGDGNADFAIAEATGLTGFVKILLGDGAGNFSISDSIAVGRTPGSICSADFNGDGNVDLVTANMDSHNISLLLGDGTGHFSTYADFSVGSGPNDITSGDFNGDGKVDLAVTNGGGLDSVWVLLGDGTGNFGTAAKYLCGSAPISVCSKDFNGDGFDDIAVANANSNNVSVLISKGTSGAFFNAVNYIAGNSSPMTCPESIVSADFNLDGKPDLAIANSYQSIVFILCGTGNGTFNTSTYFSTDYGPLRVVSADFNGDGKPDLVSANRDGFDITALINCASLGIASFNKEQDYSIYPNPTTGNFIIETNITGKQTAKIFDLNGKLVLSQNIIDKTNIDATGLDEGIYNLTIISNEGIVNKKLVIVK